MVNEMMLDNVHEIGKEEISDLTNISMQNLKDYKKRVNKLLEQLEDECLEVDEDGNEK